MKRVKREREGEHAHMQAYIKNDYNEYRRRRHIRNKQGFGISNKKSTQKHIFSSTSK